RPLHLRHVLLSGLMAFTYASAFGQVTEDLTFEVASVKPAAPPQLTPGGRSGIFVGGRGGPGTPDPGQITRSNSTLKNLIMAADDVKTYQGSGPASITSWLDTERYDIVAKVPPGATKEQVAVMWQNLLKERFGLVVHHESKEFQVEQLEVAKGGPKVMETKLDPNAPPAPLLGGQPGPPKLDKNGFPDLQGPGMIMMMQAGPAGPSAHMVGKAQPMSGLAQLLGNQLNKP